MDIGKISPFRGTTNRMNNLRSNRMRFRRGSTLVEFAMVLPILLIVSLLLVQYGIIFNTTISLTNLAREGGRFAAVNPINTTSTQTINTSKNAIIDNVQAKTPPGLTLADSDFTISCSTSNCTSGSDIKVTIAYAMRKKMFLPSKFFKVNVFGSGTYTTTSVMRVE